MQIYLCYVDNIFSNPRKFQVIVRRRKTVEKIQDTKKIEEIANPFRKAKMLR